MNLQVTVRVKVSVSVPARLAPTQVYVPLSLICNDPDILNTPSTLGT